MAPREAASDSTELRGAGLPTHLSEPADTHRHYCTGSGVRAQSGPDLAPTAAPERGKSRCRASIRSPRGLTRGAQPEARSARRPRRSAGDPLCSLPPHTLHPASPPLTWLNLSTIPRQVVHARRRRSPAPIAGEGGSSKRSSSAAYSAGNGERGVWPGPMASAARKDKARGSPAALPARRSAAPQHRLAPPRPP